MRRWREERNTACGSNVLFNTFKKVDLPIPLGPKIATFFPNSTSNVTFSKIGVEVPS